MDIFMPIGLSIVGVFVVWQLNKLIYERRVNPNRLPLPPGPKGYPVIGNLFDIPPERQWLGYDQWCKKYGGMVYFEIFGQPFLVLGNLEHTNELFEKRSSNYSDRSRFPMLVELMGWDFAFSLMRYGPWWRCHHRSFHDHFHSNVVHKYHPIQMDSARSFIRRLLASPEDSMDHIRHTFGKTIMKVTYGITVKDEHDPYVDNATDVLLGFVQAANPGTFLVDLLPAMKYIPHWFPGAEWKRKAIHWYHASRHLVEAPFSEAEKNFSDGTAIPSVASALIEKLPKEGSPNRAEERRISENVCALAYAAGGDTTVSSVQTFFSAMCLYPEVQRKAQAELDAVLIAGSLPEFEDRPRLPYINAMVKESLRWQAVTRLVISDLVNAVAHTSTEADEYNGYYIPKGTIVMGNVWSILHDQEAYPDPLRYNPDRFLKGGKLNPDIRDPDVAAFGFGRRICPGRFLSNESLFSIIAHVLSVYDILPALDEDGREVAVLQEQSRILLPTSVGLYQDQRKCKRPHRDPGPPGTMNINILQSFQFNVLSELVVQYEG